MEIRLSELRLVTFCALSITLGVLSGGQSNAPAAPQLSQVSGRDEPTKSYFALVIGINGYSHFPKLQTAVDDAEAVDSILRENYGFQSDFRS